MEFYCVKCQEVADALYCYNCGRKCLTDEGE
jgi:hypothetical protein